MAGDEVEQLFDIKRVSLGACGDEFDESLWWIGVGFDELLELRPHQQHRMLMVELRKRNLPEMRKAFDAERGTGIGTRTVGKDDQDGQRRKRPGEHPEEIARKRVEPVTILEHEHERALVCSRTKAFGEEALERSLAELRVELRREVIVDERQIEKTREQRRAWYERRIDGRQLLLQRLHLLLFRHAAVEAEQCRPDLTPDKVARVLAV